MLPTIVKSLSRVGLSESGTPAARCPALIFRQAEVKDLRQAALGDKNIRRLHIPMDDVLGMRRFQRVGNLGADGSKASSSRGRPPMRCFKVSPSMKLHDDEPLSIVTGNLVDGADIGWFSAEAARASRRKRSSACGLCATSSGRNFNATKRPSMRPSAL